VIDNFSGADRFLNKIWVEEFTWRDRPCPSVEHAFQAEKAKSSEQWEWVMRAKTPAEAKKRGRSVEMKDNWEKIKDGVMLELIRVKFTSSTTLSSLLLQTGDQKLVEGNWWGDTYWGVCRGVGENRLGEMLMRVRAELSARADAP